MATRFYFGVAVGTPPISPTYGGSSPSDWGYTSEANRSLLYTPEIYDGIALGTRIGPWTANTTTYALDRQFVSDRALVAGSISGTVSGQLRVREYATSDNVDQLCIKIFVVSNDGSTVRGTLLSRGFYGTTLEFANTTAGQNRTMANGTSLSSVTAQDGDYIVVEIGYRCSTAPTTPEAAAYWGGDISSYSDLPQNQTSTSTLNGWIEFSQDLAFQTNGWGYIFDGVQAEGQVGSRLIGGPVTETAVGAAVATSAIGTLSYSTTSTNLFAFDDNVFDLDAFQTNTTGTPTGLPPGVSGTSEAGAPAAKLNVFVGAVAGTAAVGTLAVDVGQSAFPGGVSATGTAGAPTATVGAATTNATPGAAAAVGGASLLSTALTVGLPATPATGGLGTVGTVVGGGVGAAPATGSAALIRIKVGAVPGTTVGTFADSTLSGVVERFAAVPGVAATGAAAAAIGEVGGHPGAGAASGAAAAVARQIIEFVQIGFAAAGAGMAGWPGCRVQVTPGSASAAGAAAAIGAYLDRLAASGGAGASGAVGALKGQIFASPAGVSATGQGGTLPAPRFDANITLDGVFGAGAAGTPVVPGADHRVILLV